VLDIFPSKLGGRLAAAAVSGLLLSFCFPNLSLVVLLPVCLLPLMAAVDGVSVRAAFGVGWAFGFVFWLGTAPWIAYTVRHYGGTSWPVAILALLIGAALYALPMGAMASAVAAVAPRTGFGIVATWAAAWVAQEGFRTYIFIFGGFPWALLANPLADFPALIATASLGGVFLTSFLVAAMNAALYLAISRRNGPERVRWLLGSAFAVLFFQGAGLVVLWSLGNWLDKLRVPPRSLRVGVVQPNVSQEARWRPGASEHIFRDLASQTRALCAADQPALVLWPESASPYHWPWSEAYRRDVVALCRELDVGILLNTIWTDQPESDEAPFYNSALLVTKDGPVLPPYFKQRLVPFGEFVPLRRLLSFVGPITRAVPSSFSPGTKTVLLPFAGLRLGGAVCYEVVYPWIARSEARAGADILFTLTNDSWYGTGGALRQHWQSAKVRAVETGRPLVRAAVTGISGAVDSSGHVLVEIGPNRRGAFVLALMIPESTPPAVSAGDAVLLVCAAALLAGILRRRVFPAREESGGSDVSRPPGGQRT
jgi:apolipoprotein N-acyltransferase